MVQMEEQFTCRKTKTPPKRGSVGQNGLLTLLPARADHLDLDAAVLGAAFAGLVVRVAADRVGVADGDDDLKIDAAHLIREVVELRLALGLDHRLVEVEQHVGGKS